MGNERLVIAAKRVLVADDDADVCALLAQALSPACLVTTVHDAESALEVLAVTTFDMLISDFMLPGITGIELVAHVRSGERSGHVPILMISGHDRDEIGDRALEAGADAFLNKPFSLTQLRRTIDALLNGLHLRTA